MKHQIPPENINAYICKDREAELGRQKYDISTGEFLGLYETVEFVIVREDSDELFFNYWYNKEKSKVLYSHCRRWIPNSFGGTMFNTHHQTVESGELESVYSKLYFFLPSVTDRAEEINKYLNDVSLLPIDITQGDFKQWLPDQNFEPHYLDLFGENKKIMFEYVVKALKYVAQISNANIVRNPDGLFSFVKRRCLLIGLVNQKFVYLPKSIRPVINF